MYNNIESTIINNGNTRVYFKLERRVRQGYPLSAYIYILAIGILSNKIIYDKNIKGIKIDNEMIKISLLADDLTLILLNLIINIEKTKVKLGKPINADYYPHGLSWIKTPLETFGIYITNNHEENLNYNYKPKLAKL